jgi:hypothetical protein
MQEEEKTKDRLISIEKENQGRLSEENIERITLEAKDKSSFLSSLAKASRNAEDKGSKNKKN